MVHRAFHKCNISERPGELKTSSHFPPLRIATVKDSDP